jgi:hypothetical protein
MNISFPHVHSLEHNKCSLNAAEGMKERKKKGRGEEGKESSNSSSLKDAPKTKYSERP